MKRKSGLLLLILLLCMLCGCQKKGDHAGDYQIYYTNKQGTKLVTQPYSTETTKPAEVLGELFRKMRNSLNNEELLPLLPEGVELKGYSLVDGQLTLDFNDAYRKMDNVQEILLRSGMVEMVSQVEGVRTVVFHIGEGVLTNSAGEPVGAMTAGMFINNPVGINSYQYASLPLYFANKTGDKLVREMRNVHYSSNTTLEKVVMEQLSKGPMKGELNPVLSEEVRILGITLEEGTCTLNLSREFLDKPVTPAVTPQVAVFSLVNSLCDALNVDRIQFQIEGSSDVMFGNELSFAGPFHRNSDLIEVAESTEKTPIDIGEPSVGL